jgi:hypothetical protein
MHKMMLCLVFLVFITVAFAEEIVFWNDFSSGMPSGWTVQGPEIWHISQSNYAGREVPELFCWEDGSEWTARFVSPAYDTSGYNELRFFFWHSLMNPGSENYTLRVQVSSDMLNWTPVWTTSGNGEITGQYVSVTIPRTYLNTTTFHIAFVVEGLLSVSWFIDNMQLNILSRLVSGTWTAAGGPYYINSVYIVPQGAELFIEPGVEVIAGSNCGIEVYGYIEAAGTPSEPVIFTSDGNLGGWKGISLFQPDGDEITFENCIFEYCQKGEGDSGGALHIESDWDRVSIQNCRFSENFAGNAGAIYMEGAWQTYIINCLFERNSSSGTSSTLCLDVNDYFTITGCAFINNTFVEGENAAHMVVSSNTHYAYMNMNSVTFANNYGGNAALWVGGNTSQHLDFSNIYIYNSIFWDPYVPNEAVFNEALTGGRVASFNYCDINSAKISGVVPVLVSCINTDPMFISTEDCHLLGSSPCVNTGQTGGLDPDGTRKDIGAYPVFAKPVIAEVSDVPWDQGRQAEVFWNRSGMDNTYMPNAFYSVWRGDTFRGQAGIVISSPLELAALSDLSDVWWQDRSVAWHYMGQFPAYNFDNYGFISPTLRDSCSTGTNAVPFRVVYQWNAGFCTSAEVSGYSVDNIPPDAVRNLALIKEEGNVRLVWSAVTAGTHEGSSYPELNGVYYRIYGSDDPYFDISPATYLLTTADNFRIVDYLTQPRRFFRIVTTDQLP